MDLLTLAMLCGPLVAPATTLRVIEVESAGQVYAIHDNSAQRSFMPATLSQAVALATFLIQAGHNLDLGLMQINYRVWLKPAHEPLERAFDACSNVAFGTTILSAAYAHELPRAQDPTDAMARTLSVYNSGDALRSKSYADHVFHAHRKSVPFRVAWGSP